MNLMKMKRKKLGWSVETMAYKIGISPRTVENYEQGRKMPMYVFNFLKKLKTEGM